jgi:prepilin-type N-terminal cleavage/methylation domain-containing protein
MQAQSDSGFAMMETLVALAVAAIASAGLIAALSSAGARSAEVKARDSALRTAQNLIVEAEAAKPGDVLATEGRNAASNLKWVRRIISSETDYLGMERIEVEVRWTSLRKSGVTRLQALRIAIHE